MNANDRKLLKEIAISLRVKAREINGLAEQVEGYVMKQTTQRSKEFRGGANC